MNKITRNILKYTNIQKIILFSKENNRTILTLFIFTIFTDILFIKTSRDIVIFGLLLVYIIFIKNYQIKSKETFLLCLSLLLLTSIEYLLIGASVSTEKAAVWTILFFVIGVLQQWRE